MADPDPKKVFVIHGRNHRARDAVKELLRAAGLQPLEWGQARALTKKPNAFIWDIVEAGFGACATAVVLMTGDEIVQVRPEFVETRDRAEDKEPAPQSRPNVLIEMGAALARGRYSVVIAQVGEHRRISDIEGMHICHLRTDAEARQDLIDRLKDAGATPDDTAREHLSAGNFDAAVVPFRAPAAKSASEGPDPCPPGSDEERILALLYKAGQRPLSRLQLANKLSLEPGPLDVALDELKDGELIDAQYSITMEDEEPNPNYYITPKGRKLARQREL